MANIRQYRVLKILSSRQSIYGNALAYSTVQAVVDGLKVPGIDLASPQVKNAYVNVPVPAA